MLLLLLACVRAPDPAVSAPPTPIDAACLEKGDAADGSVDKVVHRCPNCSFVMDGEEKYTSHHEGYTFHSCSPTCQKALDADPGKVLARACQHP